MSWDLHISIISAKAFKSLCFIRRKLPKAPMSVKLAAYKALVRPCLEYASCLWDPYRQKNIVQLERVQRSAVRFICSKYKRTDSVTEMMNYIGLDTLQERRTETRLKYLYLIYNNLTKMNNHNYIKRHTQRTSARFDNGKMIQEYNCLNDTFKYSFFPRTISAWNKLPREVVDSPSVEVFLTQLRKMRG